MERRERGGFTLVELLTVVAIIAVLVSLLFPAGGAAIDAALEFQCANNIRQLALCVITYCRHHDGCFPYVGSQQYPASANDWLYIGNTTKDTSNFDISKGALAKGRYIGDPSILVCPKDDGYRGIKQAIRPPVTSYALNGSVTYYKRGQGARRIDEYDPLDFMFVEENEVYSNFQDACIWPRPSGDWDSMTARHHGGGYVACMDGCALWMDWKDMRDEMYAQGAGGPQDRWNP